MKETMMMFGFLWSGTVALVVVGYVSFRVLDRIERWKRAKKMRALVDRTMSHVVVLEAQRQVIQWEQREDPMKWGPLAPGYILESRVFVPGDTDQEIIAHLTGETK